MLLDGAGWHRANDLCIADTLKLILLLLLPPDSLELNPVEHVWKYIRENIFRNTGFDSLDEVIDTLCGGLKELSEQKEVVKSMTCFDWINTLCMMYN